MDEVIASTTATANVTMLTITIIPPASSEEGVEAHFSLSAAHPPMQKLLPFCPSCDRNFSNKIHRIFDRSEEDFVRRFAARLTPLAPNARRCIAVGLDAHTGSLHFMPPGRSHVITSVRHICNMAHTLHARNLRFHHLMPLTTLHVGFITNEHWQLSHRSRPQSHSTIVYRVMTCDFLSRLTWHAIPILSNPTTHKTCGMTPVDWSAL